MQNKNDEENNNSVCVWAQNDFDIHKVHVFVSLSNRKRTHLPWMKRDETKQTEPVESKRIEAKNTHENECAYMHVVVFFPSCSVWERERERERESAKRASVLFIWACRIIIIIDTPPPQKEISCCLPVVRSLFGLLSLVNAGDSVCSSYCSQWLGSHVPRETCSIEIFSMWAKSLAQMLSFWSLLLDWSIPFLSLFTAAVLILLLYS